MDRRQFLATTGAFALASSADAFAAPVKRATVGGAAADVRLNALFDRIFADQVAHSPFYATFLGLDTGANARLKSMLDTRPYQAARAEDLARVIRRSRHASDAIVIEDDHSGEIAVSRDVSLGSWMPGQVLHIRSFSKSHGPDLRIAAIGGPAALVEPLVARRILGPGWTSRMLQTILHDLLTDSTSISEVNDARRIYRSRQRRLSEALADHGVTLAPSDGINTWLEVADERSAIVQLAAAGIRVAAGTPFEADISGHFVRVTAGHVRSDFDSIAEQLATAARA